jgi:hypothetical protein
MQGGQKMGKVAIYAKDMNDEHFANLRAWVATKGFADISEYRDVTPVRGRSGNKELGNMYQDAREHKVNFVFIKSLKEGGLIGSNEITVLGAICLLRKCGVRLISREEPWVDLSDQELAIVYLAYCEHQDSESDIWLGARSKRAKPKKGKQAK